MDVLFFYNFLLFNIFCIYITSLNLKSWLGFVINERTKEKRRLLFLTSWNLAKRTTPNRNAWSGPLAAFLELHPERVVGKGVSNRKRNLN
jgi:hypothetical protein